uniref:Uncharacterized protein n=1 Tax=Schistocephalus solidus TaxID=70667 RepID=A0A0X3P3L2_SCHSO
MTSKYSTLLNNALESPKSLSSKLKNMIHDFETNIRFLQNLVCFFFDDNSAKVLLENEDALLTKIVKDATSLAAEIEKSCGSVPLKCWILLHRWSLKSMTWKRSFAH